MKIKANEIKSETIREAIREIEEKYGISGDKAEAIASHIIYTDEDWTDEEEEPETEEETEIIDVNIQEGTVMVNKSGHTCNFYEAGLYSIDDNNSYVNETDRDIIIEQLTERAEFEGKKVIINFVGNPEEKVKETQLKKYEVRVKTNYSTRDYDSFEIEAEDLATAQANAIDEVIERGYDHEDIISVEEVVHEEERNVKLKKETIAMYLKSIAINKFRQSGITVYWENGKLSDKDGNFEEIDLKLPSNAIPVLGVSDFHEDVYLGQDASIEQMIEVNNILDVDVPNMEETWIEELKKEIAPSGELILHPVKKTQEQQQEENEKKYGDFWKYFDSRFVQKKYSEIKLIIKKYKDQLNDHGWRNVLHSMHMNFRGTGEKAIELIDFFFESGAKKECMRDEKGSQTFIHDAIFIDSCAYLKYLLSLNYFDLNREHEVGNCNLTYVGYAKSHAIQKMLIEAGAPDYEIDIPIETRMLRASRKNIIFLNCSIMTNEGIFRKRKVSVREIKYLIHEKENLKSAIGHDSTATILSNVIGIDIPVNRIKYEQTESEIAIVFQLQERPPEGKILSREEIEKIGYDFFTVEKYCIDAVLCNKH